MRSRFLLAAALALAACASARPAAADPDIELDVTLLVTTEDLCGSAEALEVSPGTPVRVCYSVRNVGSESLVTHDVTDSVLGPLLIDFPYALVPGASAFFTEQAIVTETTIFTGTWTGWTAGDADSAVEQDTAVAIVPEASASAAGFAGLLGLLAARRWHRTA